MERRRRGQAQTHVVAGVVPARLIAEAAMINVNGIQPPVAPNLVEPVSPTVAPASAAKAAEVVDVVEISQAARLAAAIQDIPDIRTDLVERVKAEIAAGTYETPERLEIAIERLIEEVFPHLM